MSVPGSFERKGHCGVVTFLQRLLIMLLGLVHDKDFLVKTTTGLPSWRRCSLFSNYLDLLYI